MSKADLRQAARPDRPEVAPLTNRDCSTAASTKEENSGCSSNGRDFSSGVGWTLNFCRIASFATTE